jgi:two-component system sensor histidine kinase/response regulator
MPDEQSISRDYSSPAAVSRSLRRSVLRVVRNPADLSCDLVVEAALRQQVEQERLINQVATQIRQSLDLNVILETAVQEVRRCLNADRLLLFQFACDSFPAPVSDLQRGEESNRLQFQESCSGRITHEARARQEIPSVLDFVIQDQCFVEVPACQEKYCKGSVEAVTEIHTTYAHAPCLIEMLERAQVKSKLIAPIVVQEQLWGLLIAHHCTEPRQWQDNEQEFLLRIAEHLAIAIQQTQLYRQLQQQAQTLEQRVIERTQELRDALNAVQSANLAKSEFLSAMSHELRTPLTCIIGMADTLLRLSKDFQGNGSTFLQRQASYLKIIQNSGEHLLELINDILDLSQIESGRAILDLQSFSLTQLATESVHLVQDKAIQCKVELQLDLQLESQEDELPNGAGDRFTADPRRIQQILFNLLSNAIKFTPAEGRVILRLWRENNGIFFQVEDTGIGIPQDQQTLIFEKFQQLDTSYHRQYEGTGLGLALTKQLVDLHGGWIEVDSVVNSGSTFTVWLPTRRSIIPKLQPNGASKLAESNLMGKRIVLIEDHEETATLICNLLNTAGYQVIWLVKGSAVIEQIEVLQSLTVLMNIDLDWLNSYEILQNLRQNPLTRGVCILALAPDSSRDRIQSWLAAGANDYIPIPITQPEHLLTKVAALIADSQG